MSYRLCGAREVACAKITEGLQKSSEKISWSFFPFEATFNNIQREPHPEESSAGNVAASFQKMLESNDKAGTIIEAVMVDTNIFIFIAIDEKWILCDSLRKCLERVKHWIPFKKITAL